MKIYLAALLLVLSMMTSILSGCRPQAETASPTFTIAPAATFTPQPIATATPPNTLTPISTQVSSQPDTPTPTTPPGTTLTALPVVLPPEMRPPIDPALHASLEAISKLPGQLFFSIRGSDLLSGDIWLINNGHPPQLLITKAAYPIPSPQGDRLVFSGQAEIKVSEVGDNFLTILRNTAWVTDLTCSAESGVCQASEELLTLGLNAAGMSWSPDGSSVAFTTAGNDGKVWRSEKLYLADVNTGLIHTVTEQDGGDPQFSPDGQWIMMQSPELGYFHGFLSLIATDGSQHRVLYRMFEDDVVGWLPYWLPDNKVSVTLTKSDSEFHVEQQLIPADGEPALVGSYPETPHEILFSPDQTRMIYRAKDETGWLHFAAADGSHSIPILGTDEQFHAVAWSPDGHHVVLCRSLEVSAGPPRPCTANMIVPNYIVSSEGDSGPTIKPIDDHFRFWVDSDSYLAVSSLDDSSRVEVRRNWLDGSSEYLFTLAHTDVPTLHYLGE